MRLRRRWTPPELDASGRHDAQRAVRESIDRLGRAIERDPEVNARASKLERIRRENNLGPRIAGALGAHRD